MRGEKAVGTSDLGFNPIPSHFGLLVFLNMATTSRQQLPMYSDKGSLSDTSLTTQVYNLTQIFKHHFHPKYNPFLNCIKQMK